MEVVVKVDGVVDALFTDLPCRICFINCDVPLNVWVLVDAPNVVSALNCAPPVTIRAPVAVMLEKVAAPPVTPPEKLARPLAKILWNWLVALPRDVLPLSVGVNSVGPAAPHGPVAPYSPAAPAAPSASLTAA